jgi:hypothetical protein
MIPPPYIRLTDEQLGEFIVIYKEEFGEEISRTDASEMASRLVMLYQLLSRKLPEKQNSPPDVTQHGGEDRSDDHPRIGFQT